MLYIWLYICLKGVFIIKKFNVTGICIPEKHYMADVSNKIEQVYNLVSEGAYFAISRPRQYGKTTIINLLSRLLAKDPDYLIIEMSFEGLGQVIFQHEKMFAETFVRIIKRNIRKITPDSTRNKLINTLEISPGIENIYDLGELITDFILASEKKVVLIIDEVDRASNYSLFITFLGMLRGKYLDTMAGKDDTFYSVILAGVHDIKNIKLKMRPDSNSRYNSPWNIAASFDVKMSLNITEISAMLKDYRETNKETEFNIDITAITALSAEIYHYTSGYPFLVSKICKTVEEKLDRQWDIDGIQEAVKIILDERNTLFDDLIKNVENNRDLYELLYNILISGLAIDYNIANPVIDKGSIYGIIRKSEERKVEIHNKIYEIFLYDYLISGIQLSGEKSTNYDTINYFINEDNNLEMEKVLLKFQDLMKQEYRQEDERFMEQQGRLLFLSFIKPIINGAGFYFVETETRTNKRMDVVITYNKKKYIVELKIWRGEKSIAKGAMQLAEYLEIQNEKEGYLVIFNFNADKEYLSKYLNITNKRIFQVVV